MNWSSRMVTGLATDVWYICTCNCAKDHTQQQASMHEAVENMPGGWHPTCKQRHCGHSMRQAGKAHPVR